ncbi:MAG TPA: isoprenylcysteine carboxylmethyltransferase family protein [Chitinophagales bacterium]|nr:isoprenylcysteine carboxylmethyltransferase family protein [Chitinophagales bacterium]
MLLLTILWVIFFALHSLLAGTRVKRYAETLLGRYIIYYRLGYNVFATAFLLAVLYVMFTAPIVYLFKPGIIIKATGLALMLAGLVIMLLAFRNYDLAEFTGIKQLAQKIHHPEKLMVTGLNRYVRNPLYTGIIVFGAGWLLFMPTQVNLLSIVILYVYIYIGTLLEERKLEQVFGNDYRKYQKEVKMLIPFIF